MKTGQVKRELGRLAAREKLRERTLTDESHVDRTAALADIRVDQALSQANQSLARYGKACYFQALERELPRVVRSFCAGQSVNQDLRAEMDRLLKEDRR